MFKYICSLIIAIFILNAQEFENDLAYETSPYLLQHKNNPIHWLAYSDEAFEKAKKEHKAVFLSIGYSTCHWCHVMAKESFENEELAELFNRYFICIKVDREEMPHLDSYYQELFLKLKKRSGGWPLNAFLTYEKKPFYLATYIPPKREPFSEGLDTLLEKIYKKYTDNYESVLKQTKAIESLSKESGFSAEKEETDISAVILKESIEKDVDPIYGGFGRSRKFPEASKLSLLFDLATIYKSQTLQKQALKMLDAMALRGLYDHIEGGFFRYSVDPSWEIPHFEKMLYNQAELIPLYVKGYILTGKKLYRDVVRESITMLDKRFVKESLYYSASDADTEHKEGEYFTFSISEVNKALNSMGESAEIRSVLDIGEKGNFEGRVHINFTTDKRPENFEIFREKLLKVRQSKTYPFIDTKINTAWNAMMIEALFKASLIDKKYAQKAQEHLEALLEFMFVRGELYHQSLLGKEATQLGLLEDYSFLISALVAGYEVDFDEEKLTLAEYLLTKALYKFYKKGVWYLSDDDIVVEASTRDKYYTAPLGRMIQNLLKIASLKNSRKYAGVAYTSLEHLQSVLYKKQANAPSLAIAFLMQEMEVVTLKNKKELLQKDRGVIEAIEYPYLLTKAEALDEYLACTVRSCFAIDKSLEVVKKKIEEKIRK